MAQMAAGSNGLNVTELGELRDQLAAVLRSIESCYIETEPDTRAWLNGVVAVLHVVTGQAASSPASASAL